LPPAPHHEKGLPADEERWRAYRHESFRFHSPRKLIRIATTEITTVAITLSLVCGRVLARG
jgi:hypothetical protein